jgi:hypothetical protein
LVGFAFYIFGLLLSIVGLDLIYLHSLSLDDIFKISKIILSSILFFILAGVILKLSLASNSLEEFFWGLGKLFLALLNIAFFSMIISIISGGLGLILPLLGTLLNLIGFSLESITLKMDSPEPEESQGRVIIKMESPRAAENQAGDHSPEENQQPREVKDVNRVCSKQRFSKEYVNIPSNGGFRCTICTIKAKIEERGSDSDVKSRKPLFFEYGKTHDFTLKERGISMDSLNSLNPRCND